MPMTPPTSRANRRTARPPEPRAEPRADRRRRDRAGPRALLRRAQRRRDHGARGARADDLLPPLRRPRRPAAAAPAARRSRSSTRPQVDAGRGARRRTSPRSVRAAIEPPVAVYRRHGPLLRALAEAAAARRARSRPARRRSARRFDELVARRAAATCSSPAGDPFADVEETARALNLLNESYLLDAFGREPRVSVETAARDPDRDLGRR